MILLLLALLAAKQFFGFSRSPAKNNHSGGMQCYLKAQLSRLGIFVD